MPKGGFETNATFDGMGFGLYAVAQPVDVYGDVLGSSEAVKAFVPAEGTAGCDGMSCGTGVNYTSAATASCAVETTWGRFQRPSRVHRFRGGFWE